MNVTELELPGVFLIEPKSFGDDRGFFMETFNEKRYEDAGLPSRFVQDNLSFSRRGILRGLHYQYPNPQGKLVQAVSGEVFDVAVDIRAGSPNFGKWTGARLSAENKHQLWVPEGFAHGFVVLSESALFSYKCTTLYNGEADAALLWNDPEIGVRWPDREPTLSEKDSYAPLLRDIPPEKLPRYEAARR